jgi:hypothetical protein
MASAKAGLERAAGQDAGEQGREQRIAREAEADVQF